MKKRTRGIVIATGIAALLVLGGLLYFRFTLVLAPPARHEISADENMPLEDVAEKWLSTLVRQRQNPLAPAERRIKGYNVLAIQNLQHPELEFLHIQFTFTPAQGQTGEFDEDWRATYQGGQYHCDWYILFHQGEPEAYFGGTMVTRWPYIMNEAEYDAHILEEQWRDVQNHAEIPAEPKLYTYKIEGETLYVSYNAGADWIEVPLPIENLDVINGGSFRYNVLQEGSYLISPEKTAFLYGGWNFPLTCVYSDDSGTTWNTARVDTGDTPIDSAESKHISFADDKHGMVAVGWDRVMASQGTMLFATADGGAAWAMVGAGPGTKPIRSLACIDESTAYISYTGMGVQLYKTADRGLTWSEVQLDIPDRLAPWFTQAGTPTIQDGRWELLVGEDAMSDYSGKQDHYLRFVSKDNGETWQYVDTIQIEQWEPG